MNDKRLWAVRVTVLATDAEMDEIADRIGASICGALDHPGPCANPWEINRTPLEDLDEPERSTWPRPDGPEST